jgi:hypothetical protein
LGSKGDRSKEDSNEKKNGVRLSDSKVNQLRQEQWPVINAFSLIGRTSARSAGIRARTSRAAALEEDAGGGN